MSLQTDYEASGEDVGRFEAELISCSRFEYCQALLNLLEEFAANDVHRFIGLWQGIREDLRGEFVAFVVTGQDPKGEFVNYLDEQEAGKEAVDFVFAKHLQLMPQLAVALDNLHVTPRRAPGIVQAENGAVRLIDTETPTAADEEAELDVLLAQTLEAKSKLDSFDQRMSRDRSGELIRQRIRQSLLLARDSYRALESHVRVFARGKVTA